MTDILNARCLTSPAAYVACIDNGHVRIPYGMGETAAAAFDDARDNWADATPAMQRHFEERIRAFPLDADEASEHAEFFATPWGHGQ